MFEVMIGDVVQKVAPEMMRDLFPNVMVDWNNVPDDLLTLLEITRAASETATLEDVRKDLKAAVSREREVIQGRGMKYTFPDGLVGTVQTRNDRDLLNVSGQAGAATILTMQSVTDPVMSFRDDENQSHDMTPAQMLAMCLAVSVFVNTTYDAKWAHDDAISSWDGTTNYDVTTGWPG